MNETSNTKGKRLKFPISSTHTVAAQVKPNSSQTSTQAEPLTPKQQKQLADWQTELNEEEAA